METSIVKLDLMLDRNKEEDKAAYARLKQATSGAERKALLLSFLRTEQHQTLLSKVLRLSALGISTILVCLSVHFTHDFNSLVMAKLWAFLLSLSLVVFTSFALTFASYCTGLEKTLFRVLWVIGILYSIFTAFAGQYNSFRSYTTADTSSAVMQESSILRSQIKQHEANIKELKASQKPYHDLITDLSSSPEKKVEFPKTWSDANYNFNRLQTKIESEQKLLKECQDKLINLSKTDTSVQNKTVYHWLSDLLHLPADLLQFFILVLPSCFIDFASSLLLSYALGSRKK